MFSGKKPNYAHSCFLYFTSKSKLVNWIARVNFVTVKYLVCLTLVFHQVLDSGKMGVLSASKRALFSFSSIILNWCPPPPCHTTVSHCHCVLPYHSHTTSHISNLLHLNQKRRSKERLDAPSICKCPVNVL